MRGFKRGVFVSFKELDDKRSCLAGNRTDKNTTNSSPNQFYPDFYETPTEAALREQLDQDEIDQTLDLLVSSARDLVLLNMDKTDQHETKTGNLLVLDGFLSTNNYLYGVSCFYSDSDIGFDFTRINEYLLNCENWSSQVKGERAVRQIDFPYDPSKEPTTMLESYQTEQPKLKLCLDMAAGRVNNNGRLLPFSKVELMFEALNSEDMAWGGNKYIINQYLKSLGLPECWPDIF